MWILASTLKHNQKTISDNISCNTLRTCMSTLEYDSHTTNNKRACKMLRTFHFNIEISNDQHIIGYTHTCVCVYIYIYHTSLYYDMLH